MANKKLRAELIFQLFNMNAERGNAANLLI